MLMFSIAFLLTTSTVYGDEAFEARQRGDNKTAYRLYLQDAEQGDAISQFNLGSMYDRGEGVVKDHKQAVYWLRKAAKQGEANAQIGLGFNYEYGRGVKEDAKQAVYWYRKAAEQGNASGQAYLGKMYLNGMGVKQDHKQAVIWSLNPAEKGNGLAANVIQSVLASHYGHTNRMTGVYSQEIRSATERYLKDVKSDSKTKPANRSSAHNKTSTISTSIKDITPPAINLNQRDILPETHKYSKTIRGQASDKSGVAIVTINGEEASLDEKGNFSASVLLVPGNNEIKITAIDRYRNTASKKINIKRGSKVVKSKDKILNVGEYHALLIAVEQYDDDKVDDLVYPVSDAQKLKQILKNYSFRESNIKLLENPMRSTILLELGELRKRLSKDDNLLIFYAGHGYWDKDIEQGYWLPRDAEIKNDSQWLSNYRILKAIEGIKTNHTLLISDACFSGGIFKTRNFSKEMPQEIKTLLKKRSRTAMTSGVLQKVPDKSIFMKYLVKKLIQNREPYLSAEQLLHDIKPIVMNNSPAEAELNPQYGIIRETGDEFGDFIFVRTD